MLVQNKPAVCRTPHLQWFRETCFDAGQMLTFDVSQNLADFVPIGGV